MLRAIQYLVASDGVALTHAEIAYYCSVTRKRVGQLVPELATRGAVHFAKRPRGGMMRRQRYRAVGLGPERLDPHDVEVVSFKRDTSVSY